VCLHHRFATEKPHRFPHTSATMADAAAQQVPTFKLVLVGDGGTGKVCSAPRILLIKLRAVLGTAHQFDRATPPISIRYANTVGIADHLRQAPFDRRVREEVHGHSRRRGPSPRIHNRKITSNRLFPLCPARRRSSANTSIRTSVPSSSMSGIPQVRRSSVVCVMVITSTASAVSSCSMLPRASHTRTSPTGTVCPPTPSSIHPC